MHPADLPTSHPRLASQLQALENQALRGEVGQALTSLGELVETVPHDERALVAVASQAATLGSLGADHETVAALCQGLLENVREPYSRGQVHLCLGHMSQARHRRRAYAAALSEFTKIHDIRGIALALGWLALPSEGDSEVSDEYRARLGRDAVRYAEQCRDPYVLALTTGHLAASETVLGLPTALDHWRAAASVVAADCDTLTANVVGLNYLNWALAAVGLGYYHEARRALAEGEWVIRGDKWSRTFAAIESIVRYRSGALTDATLSAEQAITRVSDDDRASAVGIVVRVACELETARSPDIARLEDAVTVAEQASEQIGCFAAGIQARVRSLRREPQTHRGLPLVLERAVGRNRRFGWEDVAMALVDTNLRVARRLLHPDQEPWPTGARAAAARAYVRGRLRGESGHDDLRQAGEAFAALPEPMTAGLAFHAAARVAPDITAGNDSRMHALQLFQQCKADRSLAKVLRDRRLHRTGNLPRIPPTQRNAPSLGLTRREQEVAVLAQRGLTADEIARELTISLGTARNHVFRIREKLGGVPKRKLVEIFAPADSDA